VGEGEGEGAATTNDKSKKAIKRANRLHELNAFHWQSNCMNYAE